MLPKIEWGVQNGPNRKYEVLPTPAISFGKFCFSLRTSDKELIWCTNYPNFHIYTFNKSMTFIWVCFFAVSNLNRVNNPHSTLNWIQLMEWAKFQMYQNTNYQWTARANGLTFSLTMIKVKQHFINFLLENWIWT